MSRYLFGGSAAPTASPDKAVATTSAEQIWKNIQEYRQEREEYIGALIKYFIRRINDILATNSRTMGKNYFRIDLDELKKNEEYITLIQKYVIKTEEDYSKKDKQHIIASIKETFEAAGFTVNTMNHSHTLTLEFKAPRPPTPIPTKETEASSN